MPEIEAEGLRIYYERRGAGPPLLFLNGSGSTLASSGLLIDLFTGRFDVAAHDQRGLGCTAVPPGPYSMADYAADAVAVLDAVGWPTARVVGVSFGGMVAQELAAMLADRSGPPAVGDQARGEYEQLLARARHDVLDRLQQITAPTLVASGRFDGIAPVANGEAIAARIPGAELRVYDGGHAFFVQDRAALPEILDFLAR